jgi:hypothetical protein
MIPVKLAGDTLYPLNKLRGLYPELYTEQRAKYSNRPHVPESYIEPLDCAWGDVVFLTPVHPQDVFQAISEAGFQRPQRTGFFEIDAESLDPALTTIWLGHAQERKTESYLPYETNRLKSLQSVSDYTRAYYADCKESNVRPLLWHGLTHVLYKGEIHISTSRRIYL